MLHLVLIFVPVGCMHMDPLQGPPDIMNGSQAKHSLETKALSLGM